MNIHCNLIAGLPLTPPNQQSLHQVPIKCLCDPFISKLISIEVGLFEGFTPNINSLFTHSFKYSVSLVIIALAFIQSESKTYSLIFECHNIP